MTMDPTCISAATVLRCTAFSDRENIVFIVPAALEFMASCTLFFLKWGSGSQHLLLVAEGCIYFILSLLELLAVVPLSINNLNRFRSFDTGIGIASFIPLLLYTTYLSLYAYQELFPTLPKYAINVVKVSLFITIPILVTTNEVASIVGISVSFDSGLLQIPSFAFADTQHEWRWLFFTALTLALLAAYQAAIFALSFFQFILVLAMQRQGRQDIKISGIGWISAGIKFGTIETIIGFAGGSFEISMTRRVMKLLGRVCLCVGLVIGADLSTTVKKPPYENLRRPAVIERSDISYPRPYSFPEISPKNYPEASPTPKSKTPHYLTFSQRQRLLQGDTGNSLSARNLTQKVNQQRVTVLHNKGGPPLLQMRLSTLDVPFINNNNVNIGRGAEGSSTKNFLDLGLSSTHVSEEDILRPPQPQFAQVTPNRTSNSASSIAASDVQIINAPRRTISQRSAEAKLLRTRPAEKKMMESVDIGDIYASFSDSDKSKPKTLKRPPSPVPFTDSRFSFSPSSNGRGWTESRSMSLQSVSDSLRAVQELASQFPPLPSQSLDRSEYARSSSPTLEAISDASSSSSVPYVRAIGSPSEMEAPTPRHSPRVSQGGTVRTQIWSRLYEVETAWSTPRYPARALTPSSAHTHYSALTIKPTTAEPMPPLRIPPPDPELPPLLFSLVASRDANDSKYLESPPGYSFQKIDPSQRQTFGSSRSTETPNYFLTRERSPVKPIVVPRRRSNLPKAVQSWDDDYED